MLHRTVLKPRFIILVLLLFLPAIVTAAEPISLDNYLLGYSYDSRKEMKTSSKQALDWLEDGKAILVDIRFAEEQLAWSMGFGLKIPLNELPRRFKELPWDKIIVTACPHKDRATIAMLYLRTKGFDARYLTDGLIGMAEPARRGCKIFPGVVAEGVVLSNILGKRFAVAQKLTSFWNMCDSRPRLFKNSKRDSMRLLLFRQT